MADPVTAGVVIGTAVLGAAATFTAAAFSTAVPLTVAGLHKAYQHYKQKRHPQQRVVVVRAPDGQLIMVPYDDPRLRPGWQHEPQYYAQYLSPGAGQGSPHQPQQAQYYVLGGSQDISPSQQQTTFQFTHVSSGQQYLQQPFQQFSPVSATPASDFIVQQQTPVRPAALMDFPAHNREIPRRRLRDLPCRMCGFFLR